MARRLTTVLAALVVLSCFAPAVLAQGRGEGAVVIHDNARIYAKSTGSESGDVRMRGDVVVGVTTMGLHRDFQFEDEDGRLHVNYFRDADQKGMPRIGWMDPADLELFTYECGCGSRKQPCSPYSSQGFILRWNVCFNEAKDKKLADLKARGEQQAAAPAPTAEPKKSAERPLTDDDVIGMVKAGLGDQLTIAKIKQAQVIDLDVSADALVRMRKAGASKAVLDAVMKRSTEPGPK